MLLNLLQLSDKKKLNLQQYLIAFAVLATVQYQPYIADQA